jgi:hypothetical protein
MSAECFDAQNISKSFLNRREHRRNKIADVSRFGLVGLHTVNKTINLVEQSSLSDCLLRIENGLHIFETQQNINRVHYSLNMKSAKRTDSILSTSQACDVLVAWG